MGMTTEFKIYDLFALDNMMVREMSAKDYMDSLADKDFDDFGHVLDNKWLIILNAEQWQDLNPYDAFIEKLDGYGIDYELVAKCEIEVDCYLKT